MVFKSDFIDEVWKLLGFENCYLVMCETWIIRVHSSIEEDWIEKFRKFSIRNVSNVS